MVSSPPSSAGDTAEANAVADDRDEAEEAQQRRRRRRGEQRRFRGGGLRDKPGKPPDHYHTCYCLSGLSAAQEAAAAAAGAGAVVGGEGNRLERTHPLLNVVEARVCEAAAFFSSLEGGGAG